MIVFIGNISLSNSTDRNADLFGGQFNSKINSVEAQSFIVPAIGYRNLVQIVLIELLLSINLLKK
jgi:hypothetical protein